MESYEILERIGEGSFGRVYRGRRRGTGQFVALKFMSKNGKSGAELAALRAEIGLLRKLDHPCIILMLDYFETPKEVVLVTEYAHGELWQILTDDKSLPEEVVASVARQLVDALHYLHSHRIVHRDMKPQNVLVSSGGVVKLADFGFARQMSASTVMLTSIKGTPLYLAPEIFCDHAYEYKADLWGLGVMLYELAAGEPPFYANNLHALMRTIMAEDVRFPTSFSADFQSFLSRLLKRNPKERGGWPELLYHPWITSVELPPALASALPPLPPPPAPARAAAAALDGGSGGSGGGMPAAPLGADALPIVSEEEEGMLLSRVSSSSSALGGGISGGVSGGDDADTSVGIVVMHPPSRAATGGGGGGGGVTVIPVGARAQVPTSTRGPLHHSSAAAGGSSSATHGGGGGGGVVALPGARYPAAAAPPSIAGGHAR